MVDAAERLMAERGIDAVPLRDVLEAAGQRNKSAAHYHFGSREGLIRGIIETRMAPIDDARRELLANAAESSRSLSTADLVAALVEPLSCAVRAVDVLRSQVGARVLLYGAGTMGLVLLQLAQRTGATSVDVVELSAVKRAVARDLGCSSAVEASDALAQGPGWDVVVDATGGAGGAGLTVTVTFAEPAL